MDWSSFGKRLTLLLVICVSLALVFTFVLYHLVTLQSFGVVSFIFGVVLTIFGACLRTPFIEGIATYRYAANPQQTRDTIRHYSDRREDQARSSIIVLVTGIILLLIGLTCLTLFPILPS